MKNASLVRGSRFYFQRDINNGWAWSLTAIDATADKLVRPADCGPDDYGHKFDSVDTLSAALDKWTDGSFEVTWLQFKPEAIREMSSKFGIYRDGALHNEYDNTADFLAIAEELAHKHTAHTWTVMTHGQYLVAIFRRPMLSA